MTRSALRDLSDPRERVRYMRRRLEKRESTPGVSWDEGDHADMRWALDIVEKAITAVAGMQEYARQWPYGLPAPFVYALLGRRESEELTQRDYLLLDKSRTSTWAAIRPLVEAFEHDN